MATEQDQAEDAMKQVLKISEDTKVIEDIDNAKKIVNQAPDVKKPGTGGQNGGKRLKKVAVLLKKAAEKLPALSDINSKVLKSKVKTAKKKLLKASAKAKKASKKVMKAGQQQRRSKNSNSSRKSSRRK